MISKLRIATTSTLVVFAAMIPRPSLAQEQMTGWVGVAYTTNGQPDRDGRLVFLDYPVIESVTPNSPAERAGLSAGDTILAMNSQDLRRTPLPIASMIQPGRKIIFRYRRNDIVREATVIVAPRPQGSSATLVVTVTGSGTPEQAVGMRVQRVQTDRREKALSEIVARQTAPLPILPPALGFNRSIPILGAELTALNDGLRALVGLNTPGIFVVNVATGSPAGESGMREGDVILRAARLRVADPGDLIKLLSEARGSLRLEIVRMKKPETVTLRW